MTIRNALVTGATGMLGSHIVDGLVGSGVEVIATDLAPPEKGYAWEAPASAVTYAPGDIRDKDLIGDLVARADVVVHVAAVLSKAQGDPPGPIMEVNIAATHALFEAAARTGTKVVFASSGSVYGPNRDAVDGTPAPAFVEDDPSYDLGFYALSKHVNELHAEAFGRLEGLSWVALRCSAMFGSRLRMGLTTRWLLSVLDDVEAGRTPRVDGDPNGGLDWIHVADAAECFVRAVTRDVPNGPINVSTGVATRLEDACRAVLAAAGYPQDIEWTGAHRPDGRFSSARYYSSERAGEVLGFRPATDVSIGMDAFVAWRNAMKGA
ncbi:SDR family oxidoreductase [Microbacterium pseudoresistens]|uniref:UDP-glucose 4-epimerase n=1 Tax=Microbacterium pseudoresistens TaxID=640634 RepID=A0A7Y9EUM0_9MICO|nr:NAD(P)-dependent oxidoreductase [Microbacterium pseudoresistens]NYD54253.1 UDP-glucose 4-epimerase [Microbacterium pseudoresistens]